MQIQVCPVAVLHLERLAAAVIARILAVLHAQERPIAADRPLRSA
jgi:hypothetical protein